MRGATRGLCWPTRDRAARLVTTETGMRSRSSRPRAWVLAALVLSCAAPARAQTSLDELLAHAEGHAPALLAAQARLADGDAAREGASPLLREGLDVLFGMGPRADETGDVDYDMLLQISQAIELAGERGTRLDAAERLADLREAELVAARWQVHREIHLAYHHAIHARQRMTNEDRWIELGQEVLRIAQARATVGEGTPVDVVVATAELARARQRRLVAEAEYREALMTLCEVAGWPVSAPPEPEGALDVPEDVPGDDQLLALARESHPALRAADAAVEEARAITVRADRAGFPSLSIGVQLAREGAAGQVANYIGMLTLGGAIPLWQQNTQERAEARASLSIAEAERDALPTAIEARVLRAASTVRLTTDRLRIYQRDVVPGFESALAGLARAYEVGEIDLATLGTARSSLLSVQTDALDAYVTYHDALAELETQVGSEIDEQEQGSAPSSPAPIDSDRSTSGGEP